MSEPIFSLTAINPFGLTHRDPHSITFVDIDGDGDLDAFIGSDSGKMIFFRNKGTASNPEFDTAKTNRFGFTDVGLKAHPTFADIDDDGDLDAFVGNRTGDTLFFNNIGTPGNPQFAAASTNPFGLNNVGASAHPTFVDIDADGDLDSFIGNQDGNTLFFINEAPANITQSGGNTAVTEGGMTDTYNVVLNSQPIADVTITVDSANLQINSDVNTLTFTPSNWDTAQTVTVTAVDDTVGEGNHTGVIQHTLSSSDNRFNNITADSIIAAVTDNDLPTDNPNFNLTAPVINPFGLDNFGRGSDAKPTLVDIDGDGDSDAFVSYAHGNTFFFENTGTAISPVFVASMWNPFGLSDAGTSANITFADIDGDGDLDAFIGNDVGNILFFKNAGTVNSPVFLTAVTNPFGLSSIGSSVKPTFVDIDSDGVLDAFIGNSDGNTLFYANTGSANNPVFTAAITNPFGLSDAGFYASPTFVDIGADGDLDALIGNGDGNILFHENTGTASTPVFATAMTNPFGLNNAGPDAKPTLVDIDGDGDLDALVGNRDGDMFFFESTTTNSVLLFSTPGNDILTGSSSDNDTVSYINAPAAVTVSLLTNAQQDTIGHGLDTLIDIENLVGSGFNDELVGNVNNNTLNGEAGNDTLKGWSGADTMIGGLGDDIYFVENLGDVVIELPDQGIDHVNSKVTYKLPANVENLTLKRGAWEINGTGNELDNILIGNKVANKLNGKVGNDQLDGKAGADTLIGGRGDDLYIVDNVGDSVIENPNEGRDKINSKVTYTLPDNVEVLTLKGTAAIDGTGNTQNNKLIGNSADNQLNGGAGNDRLDGKNGNNTLTGGAGEDSFEFTTTGHIDTITDFTVIDDTITLDNAVFTVLTVGELAANHFIIGTQALDADDYIIYNDSTGALSYDADGNGAGGAVQIATVGVGLSMTNPDFVVI